MNVLILSIFNKTCRNEKLLQIHRDNFSKYDNIDYYFIMNDETIDKEYVLIGDMLFIKGVEDYLNILDKTLKAFLYFNNVKKYDFVVRTNISSVIDCGLLYKNLTNFPKTNIYNGAGYPFKLNLIDTPFGITETNVKKYSLKHLVYFQGTLIIFSYDILNIMIHNLDKFKYELIDDVSFGLFMKTYMPDAYYLNVLNGNNIQTKLSIRDSCVYDTKYVLYRHKSYNDENDIKNMIDTYNFINNV